MMPLESSLLLADQIVDAIGAVIGPNPAALHEPIFGGNEWLYVKECLDTSFVSSVGKFVDRFERDLEDFTGSEHAVAVVNGTAGLHIALLLADVKAGDEVLTPALTFVATANAVAYCGAVPHFVDSEECTLGVDANKLRDYLKNHTEQRANQCINRSTGRVIRAIVPMHTFGHPVNLEGLLAIARDFNITIVEDAAESLGSYYGGQHTGTFGLLGTLSFNGNKTITTGGGGAILTNDVTLARRAKHLTTTAKLPHTWEYRHDVVGYNYRLPNINAALGCAQLEQLPAMLAAKRELFLKYGASFCDILGVTLMVEPDNCKSNYWLQTLVLDKPSVITQELILKKTNALGYMTRPAWILLPELNAYKGAPKMQLETAHSISQRVINIPSSAFLSQPRLRPAHPL
jgi:aminotransferase in exopolysaccharide biosynthesis